MIAKNFYPRTAILFYTMTMRKTNNLDQTSDRSTIPEDNYIGNIHQNWHKYENKFLKSDISELNEFMGGGLIKGGLTEIVGNSGSGKTTFSYLFIKSASLYGNIIYIDTENNFCPNRFSQIIEIEDIFSKVYIINVDNFEEQKKIIKSFYIINNISLIIFDSIITNYRISLYENPQKANSELAEQLKLLSVLARKRAIPVIVINQTYIDFNSEKLCFCGGDVLNYWCKYIYFLKKIDSKKISIKIIKHKFLPSARKIYLNLDRKISYTQKKSILDRLIPI